MTLGDLCEIGYLIDLGLDPLNPKLTKEIIADKKPFSDLRDKIYELQAPVMDNEVAKLTLRRHDQ